MALREPLVVPDGFRVEENALGEDTRRDPTVLRHWRGLSADDAALLYRWVHDLGEDLEELHTDVPVGICPEIDGGPADGWFAKYIAKAHPLRIDAVVLVRGQWWVIEVKADAGYTALGQVLCYTWYAVRTNTALVDALAGVVTDKVQACIAPVYESLGVRVFEGGEVLSESSR